MAFVIEVRDQELYVFRGRVTKHSIKPDKYFRVFLSEPIIVNNEIVFNEHMLAQVRNIFAQMNIFDKKVHVVINHRLALTKDLSVPKTDRRRLGFLIDNEMTAMFNLTRDYVIDYRVLRDLDEDGIRKTRVLASAVKTSIIRGLELFFEELGMKIQSLNTASSSFLQFVEKNDLVDSNGPVIVIDASSSYIRYYLFHRKDFVLMRSLYINVDDDHATIFKRALQVLELMSQSQSSTFGQEIDDIKLVGYEKRFSLISNLTDSKLHMKTTIPDIGTSIDSSDKELYDFCNSMGVLL